MNINVRALLTLAAKTFLVSFGIAFLSHFGAGGSIVQLLSLAGLQAFLVRAVDGSLYAVAGIVLHSPWQQASADDSTTKAKITLPSGVNLSLILIPLLLLQGCAISHQPVAVTAQQAAIEVKTLAASPQFQANAKLGLSAAAKLAPLAVKDSVDRAAIRSQLLSWGIAVSKALATGQPISASDLKGIFSTFNSKADAVKFADAFGSFTGPTNDYLDSLKDVEDVQLLRTWANIMAYAAIAGGS